MTDQRWYVAQLKAGRERVAIHGLADQGFESYYPQIKVLRPRLGRVVETPEPVFPLYLFLQSEPDWACFRAINNTRGVSRLLGNNGPCAVPDRDILYLQQRDNEGLLRHHPRRHVRQGDTIEFRCGTFVGLTGICQWTRRERIGVLLQILGGATVITAPRDWLRLAAA